MQSPFYIRWPDKKDIDGLKSRGPPGFVHACGIGDTREIVNRKREGDRGKDYLRSRFWGICPIYFFPSSVLAFHCVSFSVHRCAVSARGLLIPPSSSSSLCL